jgi:hypothetical protein
MVTKVIIIIIQHYNPLSLALASLATNAPLYSLSQTLVLHLFTSISPSPIRHHTGVTPPHQLVGFQVTPLTFFLHPLLRHAQAIPFYVLQ